MQLTVVEIPRAALQLINKHKYWSYSRSVFPHTKPQSGNINTFNLKNVDGSRTFYYNCEFLNVRLDSTDSALQKQFGLRNKKSTAFRFHFNPLKTKIDLHYI